MLVNNGILNLRTGEFTEQFDAQVLFFNKFQYNYNPYVTEEDTEYMNSIYDRLFNIPLGPDFLITFY